MDLICHNIVSGVYSKVGIFNKALLQSGDNQVPHYQPVEQQQTHQCPPLCLWAASRWCHLEPQHGSDGETVFCRAAVGVTITHSTFRQADWAAVIQVLSGFGHSEALLVRAELPGGSVSWRGGCEHSRPAFRWWDFNPHQAILPPPVTDPRLPISEQTGDINHTAIWRSRQDNGIFLHSIFLAVS